MPYPYLVIVANTKVYTIILEEDELMGKKRMSNLKLMLITILVLILVVGIGVLVYGLLKGNRATTGMDNLTEIVYELDVPSKVEKDTMWYLNGQLINSGINKTKINSGYVVFGENELVGVNGDTRKSFEFTYDMPISPSNKTDRAIRLLTPTDWYKEESAKVKDSDNDGVLDIDEINLYETDPLKDFSNDKGVSDLAYAAHKEGVVSIEENGVVVASHSIEADNVCKVEMNVTGPTAEQSSIVQSLNQIGLLSFDVYGITGCETVTVITPVLKRTDTSDLMLIKYNLDGSVETVGDISENISIKSDGTYVVMNKPNMMGSIEEQVRKSLHSEIAFVVDNSGSMFTEEYVNAKSDEEYEQAGGSGSLSGNAPVPEEDLGVEYEISGGGRDFADKGITYFKRDGKVYIRNKETGEMEEWTGEIPESSEDGKTWSETKPQPKDKEDSSGYTDADKWNETKPDSERDAKELEEANKLMGLSAKPTSDKTRAVALSTKKETTSLFTEKPSSDKADDFGNDVEFKRLDLMKTLVDRLEELKTKGTFDAQYAVTTFTGDYNVVQEMSDSGKDTKVALDKLRKDYQEFNGTHLNLAITESAKTFSPGLLGKKTMIVLTDGESTGGLINGFDELSASISLKGSMKGSNINVIIIGLGDCNVEELTEMSEDLNAALYYVEDPNTLERLIAQIVGSISTGSEVEVVGDDNSKNKALILADSGFRPEVDGFALGNYSSRQFQGGSCYGFSLTTKMIFEGFNESGRLQHLDETDASFMSQNIIGSFTEDDYTMPEINLSDKKISQLTKGNVSSVTFTGLTDFLTYTDGGLDSTRYIDKGVLQINKDLRKGLEAIGGEFTMNTKPEGETFKATFKDTVKEVTAHESFELDLVAPASNGQIAEDKEVLKLITRMQLSQVDSALANAIFNAEQATLSATSINAIVKQLNSGKPVMLSISGSAGAHSVLGCKVSQSIDDPDKILIHIYDSNAPMEDKTMSLTRVTSLRLGKIVPTYKFSYIFGSLNFVGISVNEDATVKSGNDIIYKETFSAR